MTEAMPTVEQDVSDWVAIKDKPITVAFVTSAYSNATNVMTTIGEFFADLRKPHKPHPDKAASPGFVPGELLNDAPLSEGKNLADNNMKVISLLVADFETKGDYVPTIEDIRKPLAAAGLAYIIKTSFSHDPKGEKGPRYRAIVPITEAVPVGTSEEATAYSQAYCKLSEVFGWQHDQSCQNVSRYYHDGHYKRGFLDLPLAKRADGTINFEAHKQALRAAAREAVKGREPLIIFKEGNAFDLRGFIASLPAPASTRNEKVDDNPFLRAVANAGADHLGDDDLPQHPALKKADGKKKITQADLRTPNLFRFNATCRMLFLIEDAALNFNSTWERRGDCRNNGGMHYRCPNEAGECSGRPHSQGEKDNPTAFWIKNATGKVAFIAGCRTAGCTAYFGKDALLILDALCEAWGVKDAVELIEFTSDPEEARKAYDAWDSDLALQKALEEFNKQFCAVKLGGKLRIIEMPQANNGKDSTEPVRLLLKETFLEFYANRHIPVFDAEGEVKMLPVAPIWLRRFKGRNSCAEIVFDPSAPPGIIHRHGEAVFNIWRGFSIEGAKGYWSLLRCHLFENVCRGNPLWFAYVMSWIAAIVQDPCTKPEAGIAVRGRKGTGKSKVAEWIAELMPNNSVTTAKSGQVLGTFNAHHAGKLLLVSEESFWAGDKAGEAAMKHLITGKRSLIEPKGIDAFEVDDFIRLWMCANSEWVFPATEDERRLFMLEIADTRRRDLDYFRAIDAQMVGGRQRKDKERDLWTGLQAMMWDLRHLRQPAWIELRNPPATPWLAEQVEHSLPALEAWWLSTLQAGGMTTFQNQDDWAWPDSASTNTFEARIAHPTTEQARKSFDHFCKTSNIRARASPAALGRFIAKMGGRRDREPGGGRGYVYVLPPLAEAQGRFTAKYGIEIIAGTKSTDFANMGLGDVPAAELEAWIRYGLGEGGLP